LSAALLIAVMGTPGPLDAADSSPVPSICVQPEFDAGDQLAGAVLSHQFTIRNPSPRPLALQITHHAGLTVSGLPATLAAGESASVTLTSEPLGGIGEFSYVADFAADATPAIACSLEMHGRVLQYFNTDPPDQQLLLTVSPGQSERRRLSLSRKDGLPFSVRSVRWEEVGARPDAAASDLLAGKFSVSADAGETRANGWDGWISAGPLPRPGLYYARVRLATDHPRQPEVAVDVVIRNLSPLVLFPGEVHFFNPLKKSKLAAGQAPVRQLFVHALPGEPRFVPGAVRVMPDFLSVRWLSGASPRKDESVVEISVRPDAPPGPFTGEIRIARSSAPGDEERVPVEGVVQP
jgi:hypothetical protein